MGYKKYFFFSVRFVILAGLSLETRLGGIGNLF